jgi:hypothetical protein
LIFLFIISHAHVPYSPASFGLLNERLTRPCNVLDGSELEIIFAWGLTFGYRMLYLCGSRSADYSTAARPTPTNKNLSFLTANRYRLISGTLLNLFIMENLSYYQQLKPIVLNYVQHYLTDFTKHDKNRLQSYKGEFYYGIRSTGTDIFLYSEASEALFNLLAKKPTDYFKSKGLKSIYDGTVDFAVDHFLAYCLLQRYTNDRFFIGKHMEIRELSHDEFIPKLKGKIKILNELAAQLKGSVFVWEFYKKELKKEKEERARRYKEREAQILTA